MTASHPPHRPADVATVQLLGAPVRVWAKADERFQDLLREFALMQFGHDAGQAVPARLLALAKQLTGQYSGLTADNTARREAALDEGRDHIDLTYEVPVQVRDACLALQQLLEETDEYCRADQLLTLATPPVQRDFRNWFLGQFMAQIDGAPPKRWDGPLDSADE
jgi:hypothetical protein